MLVDDGLITFWIPDDFVDESSYGFALGVGRMLHLLPRPVQTNEACRRIVEDRWSDGKRSMAALDATAILTASVEETTFAGLPSALGWLTVRGKDFGCHKGLLVAALGEEQGIEVELDVEGTSGSIASTEEAFFRRLLAGGWLLSSPTAPSVPVGSSPRLLGRIGLVLPATAKARASYVFRFSRSPLRLALAVGSSPARRYPTGYFDDGDRLTVERSNARSIAAVGSSMPGMEWTEIVRRERDDLQIGSAVQAPALVDVHEVRIAELSNRVDALADSAKITLIGAAPRPHAGDLEAIWQRVLMTCRWTDHGPADP